MSRWWTERRQRVADVLLAASITIMTQNEVWTASTAASGASGPAIVGPRPLVAASYLIAALALIFRRRHPLAVLITVVTALAIPFLIFGASEGLGSFLPLLVAFYSVGAHCERRTALASLGILVGIAVVHTSRNPNADGFEGVKSAAPFWLIIALTWLTGLYLRTRRLYVAELRLRAERAETEREERERIATADERARIARELHDVIAHSMTVIVVQAEAATEMLDREPLLAREALEQIQRIGRDSLGETRRLLGILRRSDGLAEHAPQPSLNDLPTLIESAREAGLEVALTIEGERCDLPPGADVSAYRIVQEALTNTIKHAHAATAAVHVRYADVLTLEILDDGKGAASDAPGGHGLIGMRERASMYGGTLSAGPAERGGFAVRVTLPLGQTS
jgi:signal transduction histidine kinase